MAIESTELRFERWRTRGDGAALSDVFDALAPGLLRLAIHLVGDPSAAEDLVQQTFVTAMERASTWDARRPLEPWLQGILANHARDLRKLARRAHDPDFDLEAVLARAEDAPFERASRRELSGELARAVDALDEPYRAAVLLRLRHGMEAADIAHVLGRSPGAVRVQLHRARELLRKSLPASIAGALVALAGSARGMDTARGLETVRNQVLEHAARLAPAASVSGGLLGGALVMKKLVVVAVVLLAALAAFLAWTNGTDAPPHEVALATTSSALARPAEHVAAAEPLEPATNSTRAVETVAVEQAVEDEVFRGIVLDAATDQPIAGARIALYPPLSLSLREVRTRWWDRIQAMSDGDLHAAVWPQLDENTTAAQRVGLEPVRVRVAPTEGDQPIAETTSGPDGRFRLAAESVDGLLTCDAIGFARREVPTVRPDFPASTEERTIYLARNVTFRGTIVDASGAPIRESIALSLVGHAPKVLQTQNEPMREPHLRSVIVRTDADGRFETPIDAHLVFVQAVDPRWVVVEPRRNDPAKPSWPQVPWFDLVEGSGDAYVVLRPALSLLVRDADTGAPIEDAHVCVRDSATAIPRMSGWFHLEGGRLALERETQYYVHAEEAQAKRSGMTCTVWSPGHARASVTIAGRCEARVVEVELARDDSGFVRGRISHGGEAAGGARLFASEVNPTSAARREEMADSPVGGIVAGADGRFEFELPAGRYVLTIEYAGEIARRPLDVPCAGDLDIDLDATATLEVVLTQADGTPKASRAVRVRYPSGLETRAMADARGIARVGELPLGPCEVLVSYRAGDTNFRAGESRVMEILPGTNTVSFVVPGAQPIHARLVVEDGPIEGWSAMRDRWSSDLQPVDPDGRIPLDLCDDQRFLLISPTGVRQSFQIPDDAPDGTEIRVRSGGPGYRGRIVDAGSDRPLSDVDLWFTSEIASTRRTTMVTSDHDGRFEIRGLTDDARSARTVRPQMSSDEFGAVTFEFSAAPADPPVDVVLRRPRWSGGEFDEHPMISLEGRFPSAPQSLLGATAYLTVIVPGPVYATRLGFSSRVGVDGAFRVRIAANGERRLGLWGGDPFHQLAEDHWMPTGADPEVREFVLPP